MKILIVGLGECGMDLAIYLQEQNHCVVTCDDYLEKSPLSLPHNESIEGIDLAIHSPGIKQSSPWIQKIKAHKIPLVSESEYCIPKLQGTLFGVSGTNGKTTTVKLMEYALKKIKEAKAIGNCSPSFANYLIHPLKDPTLLLELSSYQIDTMHTKVLDKALLLNISQDHLDHYGSLEEYAKSKIRLEHLVKDENNLFVEVNTYHQFRKFFTKKWKTFGFEKKSDLVVPKRFLEHFPPHERLNCFAACCLLESEGISIHKMEQLYQAFEKPKHRIEWVDTIDGISFFNDSKATNVEAVKVAIKAFAKKRTFLIMGGVDKKQNFKSLTKEMKKSVKHVFLMGQIANQLEKTFQNQVPVSKVESMDEAIQKAFEMASHDDVVLLSCGSSSFDMFENYLDRGNKFANMVKRMKIERGIQ